MSKQKKARRHRSVNRTPRPMGEQRDHHHHDTCRSSGLAPAARVYRDDIEFVDGRAYPPTVRMNVDGQHVQFDFIASMHSVVTGEVTGPCADILSALSLQHVTHNPELMTSMGEQVPANITELVECFRRAFQQELLGSDERGGFVSFSHVHATHA